jgi:hypothetical protein
VTDRNYSSSEIMGLLPTLYSLLSTRLMPKVINSLCEILTVSVFRDGKATKALTEPILDWLSNQGLAVVNAAVAGALQSGQKLSQP